MGSTPGTWSIFVVDHLYQLKYWLIMFLLLSKLFFCISQGAGAFEVAARQHLVNEVKKTVKGVCDCVCLPVQIFVFPLFCILKLLKHAIVFYLFGGYL